MTYHRKYLVVLLCIMSLNVGCSDSEMKSVTAGLAAINSSEKNKPSEVVADSKSGADKSSSDIPVVNENSVKLHYPQKL